MNGQTSLADRIVEAGGFLKFVEIDASEAVEFPHALDSLRSGDFQAIIVHDVYTSDHLSPVIEQLERHDPPFLQTWFPEKFRAWFFGQNLNLAAPGLEDYFSEAALFHNQLERLFVSGNGFVRRISGVLSGLDHGRPFIPAPGPDGVGNYMFTTLRAHMEGGYIPPHFDNEQTLRPSFSHLRQLIDPHMISYVLTLQIAEEGGALEVFNCRCDPSQATLMSDDRSGRRPLIEGLESASFRVAPGAMIILDSGRYLHRVSPVRGRRKRWTACSFMSLNRQGNAMYCWG